MKPEYLLECYNAKGECVDFFHFDTPMRALEALGEISLEEGRFKFDYATCYLNQKVVWELEIK